jgi:chitinase
MTYSGFDNITITGENTVSHQKINRTCDFETIPADKLKIEIPINKINSATYNKDNKVNKLVTVFAVRSCSYDSFVP